MQIKKEGRDEELTLQKMMTQKESQLSIAVGLFFISDRWHTLCLENPGHAIRVTSSSLLQAYRCQGTQGTMSVGPYNPALRLSCGVLRLSSWWRYLPIGVRYGVRYSVNTKIPCTSHRAVPYIYRTSVFLFSCSKSLVYTIELVDIQQEFKIILQNYRLLLLLSSKLPGYWSILYIRRSIQQQTNANCLHRSHYRQ